MEELNKYIELHCRELWTKNLLEDLQQQKTNLADDLYKAIKKNNPDQDYFVYVFEGTYYHIVLNDGEVFVIEAVML